MFVSRSVVRCTTLYRCTAILWRYTASKNSVTLKPGGRGHLRSLKMAPFDRPCFNWSAIVSIPLLVVPFSSYLTLNNRDLKIWVIGHWRSFKLVPLKSLGAVSYLPFIVTVALSCIISEIKRDFGRKSWFFIPPCIRRLRLTQRWKNLDDMFSHFDRIRRCDRGTDGQTSATA